MRRKLIQAVCGAILIVVCAGMPAFGQTITFNFNSLTGYSDNSVNQASSIASQLQTQLRAQILTVCPTCNVSTIDVTATSGSGIGAVIDKTYTADNFVVGPSSGTTVKSETLGDTPANADFTNGNSTYGYSQLSNFTNQFLANTNDNDSNGGQLSELSFQFSGLTITGASFNYEIFPDVSGEQPPDLTFEAGNNTNGTDTQFQQGFVGVTPSSSSVDGSNVHSPSSGVHSDESHQQYIGSWSGTFAGSTELDFVDWPATIGIDDLSITFTTPGPPSSVPEPGSFVLLGTVALGTLLIWRRKTRTA